MPLHFDYKADRDTHPFQESPPTSPSNEAAILSSALVSRKRNVEVATLEQPLVSNPSKKKRRPTKAQRKARGNDVENKLAAIDTLVQSESSTITTACHAGTQDMQLAVAKQAENRPNIYETMFKQIAHEHPGFVHKYIPAVPAISQPLPRNRIQEQPVQHREVEKPTGLSQKLLSLANVLLTPPASKAAANISSTASKSNMRHTGAASYLLNGIKIDKNDFEVEFYQEEYSEVMDELSIRREARRLPTTFISISIHTIA